MCVWCRTRRARDELFRFVRQGDGVGLDREGKRQARGAYTCRRRECVEGAIRSGKMGRGLRVTASTQEWGVPLSEALEYLLITTPE